MTGPRRGTRQLALLDRAWLPFRIAWVLGPVDTPDIQEVRAALTILAERAPDHPFLSLLDHENGLYRTVARSHMPHHVIQMVSELSPDATVSLEKLAASLLEPQPYPLRILVGAQHVALAASHALGDGRSITRLLAEFLTTRTPTLEKFSGRTSTWGLLNMAFAQYGGRPRQVFRAVEARRNASSPCVAGGSCAGAPFEDALGEMLVWSSRIRDTDLEQLRGWRRENYSAVTMAALVFTMWFRALTRTGAVPQGFYLLVDARRYGGTQSERLWGNYAKSVYVRPASVLHPNHVATALRQNLASTRPLAALTLQAYDQARQGDAGPRAPGSTGEVEYSLTHLAGGALAQLPWLGDSSETCFVAAATPADPLGVTVTFLEIRGGMIITASLRRDNPEAARVAASLQAMTEPLLLLADIF